MNTLIQNFLHAFRRLKKNPGFTFVALFTLGLGIGANSSIFSIVNAVLLRPLPYRDPQNLVLLAEHSPQFPRLSVSYLNYQDWRSQSDSFEAMGAVRNAYMTMTGGTEAERLPIQNVTANLFSLLGIKPEFGRTFTESEDKQGAPLVALIGHSLWERKFSSSPGVLGQTITLDNQNYEIIGVMPRGFEVLQQPPDVVLPFEPWARTLPYDRTWHPGILPIARLKPGVSIEHAGAEMALISRRLEKQYPESDSNVSCLVDSMREQMVQNVRPALLVLIGAAGLVLLIACTNVANLMLVRATGRRREMAICAALGARRSDIIRQLLAESIMVAMAGGGLGLLLAWGAVPFFVRLAGSSLPRSNAVSVDAYVFGFTALIALLAGILFGMAPARHAWQVDLRETLNESNRGGATRGVLRTRAALVVSEIALATLLLFGAGLLFKSFERLSQVSPGFESDHILIANVVRSPGLYRDAHARLSFFDRLFERAAALPGVRSVGGVSVLPVTGTGSALQFNVQGRPPRSPEDYTIASYRVASEGYLKTLGIQLINGRWIEDRDREETLPVVVVNSTFARTYFPSQTPIGQHIQIGTTPDSTVPWMEIVGVVADVKQSLASESSAEMYVPYRQADKTLPVFGLSVVVRTAGDPREQANAIRSLARDIDPNQPMNGIHTMEENLAQSMSEPRFRTILLTIFAGIALTLAAVGIFGVMAYSVAQRTRELALRMALGASRGRVLQLVLVHGVRLTLIGIAIGVAATFFVTRYISTLLFNTPSDDPMTLVEVAAGLLLVSLCACYFPARRATMVDPLMALREE